MIADNEAGELRSAAVGVACLRVWLGAWFLLTAACKLPVWGHGFDFPSRLREFLELSAEGGALIQYRPFMEELVKHATAVTIGTTVLELGVGIGLVLGLFTRLASFVAIVLYTNYWLAAARMGYAPVGISLTIGVTAACLFIGNAGRFYGMDAGRARRAAARRAAASLAPPIAPRA